jgi:hypothetical protein
MECRVAHVLAQAHQPVLKRPMPGLKRYSAQAPMPAADKAKTVDTLLGLTSALVWPIPAHRQGQRRGFPGGDNNTRVVGTLPTASTHCAVAAYSVANAHHASAQCHQSTAHCAARSVSRCSRPTATLPA